jgi:hypothetical protein
MECLRVRDMLADYSVDLLDRRTTEGVKTHLETCADCAEELRILEGVVALVEQYGERQPPVGLFNGVRNRIESGDMVRERTPWWAWLIAPMKGAAMGAATAALALAMLLPNGKTPVPGPLDMHTESGPGGRTASSPLAQSIRQHAMSAGRGTLTERVAWEAMAQLVTQDSDTDEVGRSAPRVR